LELLAVDPERPDASVVERAARRLRSGDLVIFPTDTLYALGALAGDPRAAGRVRLAKGRDDRKPLPLIAADEGQARSLSSAWPDSATRLAARFWPGPLTLVVAGRADLPVEVTAGGGTVAVRVPGAGLARALCAAAGGPLVSTSANVAGAPSPMTCAEAVAGVGISVVLALDGGPGLGVPSTIVDLTSDPARLLREGAVEWAEVLGVLG
jgi:L-threonylcarbamoyladenylate synthase